MVSGIPTASGYEERIRFSEMEVVDRGANENGLVVNKPQGHPINGWDVNVAGARTTSVKRHVRYHTHAVSRPLLELTPQTPLLIVYFRSTFFAFKGMISLKYTWVANGPILLSCTRELDLNFQEKSFRRCPDETRRIRTSALAQMTMKTQIRYLLCLPKMLLMFHTPVTTLRTTAVGAAASGATSQYREAIGAMRPSRRCRVHPRADRLARTSPFNNAMCFTERSSEYPSEHSYAPSSKMNKLLSPRPWQSSLLAILLA